MNKMHMLLLCSLGIFFFISITMGRTIDTNLALGKPCKFFSSLDDEHGVLKLTDGKYGPDGYRNRSFVKYADHGLYPEFIEVDLGANATIGKVLLYPIKATGDGGSGFPKEFSIQVSRQGEPWKVVLQEEGYKDPLNGQPQTFDLSGVEARYVKVEATRLRTAKPGEYRFQLAEIEVYGQAKPLGLLAAVKSSTDNKMKIAGLKCEHYSDPIGVDALNPRLDWILESTSRGQRQTAYRVQVATERKTLDQDRGDQWDSGKVYSDQSVAVRYAGKRFKSGQKYFWKVMAWDKDNKPTEWSNTGVFVTGKFRQDEWKGKWIGRNTTVKENGDPHKAVYIRKEITVDKPVARATAFFCGLGHSEFSIDGVKVGQGRMTPGHTETSKRVQYLVYDVTDRFAKSGKHLMGAILVDGHYGQNRETWGRMYRVVGPYVNRPKMIFDLHLEHADGTETVISSDSSWKYAKGAIARNRICLEDIDLRENQPGWDKTGFDDSHWHAAVLVEGPTGRLVCQREPQVTNRRVLKPVSLTKKDGNWYYDFGREFTGAIRFRTSGKAGTKLKLHIAPPPPNPLNSRAIPDRVSAFTLAGKGIEEYASRFCYNTISRVIVEGATTEPKLEDLEAVNFSSVGEVSGSFRCSDGVINWIHESARRTQEAYVITLPNDSTREYDAYMEDPQNMFVAAAYLFDSRSMYERWHHDISDCQREDGNVSNMAPKPNFDAYNSPFWGGCLIWVPWHWYQYYGDPAPLFRSYDGMKKYMDYLAKVGNDHIQHWGLNDWQAIEITNTGIVNTPAYYLYAQVVSHTAGMLGRKDDQLYYSKLAESIRDKYNDLYLDQDTGIYGLAGEKPKLASRDWKDPRPSVDHELWWTGDRSCTQAGQIMPLALGLVPDNMRTKVESALVREIAAHDNRVSTGFVSTPYLLELLADMNPDLGHRMTTTKKFPSWYSMTAGSAGMSTYAVVDSDLMREGWTGRPVVMPSLGGNIAGWNMQSLGGIRPDFAGPGFKKFIIKPNVLGDLHWVETRFNSVHGKIVSNWRRRGDQLLMEVTVPANTTATVYVPAKAQADVTESGMSIKKTPGVQFLRTEADRVVLSVKSGQYAFVSKWE
jgi:alpha-L-rhamnosidase